MHAALHVPALSPGASLASSGVGAPCRCRAVSGQPARRVATRAVGRLSYVSADGQLIEISEDDAPLEVRVLVVGGNCQSKEGSVHARAG